MAMKVQKYSNWVSRCVGEWSKSEGIEMGELGGDIAWREAREGRKGASPLSFLNHSILIVYSTAIL
jgi:hypothetical protein